MSDREELSAAERERVRELFGELVELDVAAQAEALQRTEDAPQVVAEVAALLEVDVEAVFAERQLGQMGADVIAGSVAPGARPTVIGPYRVLDVLGEGGMGTVYRARQQQPIEREVAIKVIRRGFESTDALQRFAVEKQALARMNHPSIARVFEAGATADGLPFLAMEFVEGQPIHRFCDDRRLAIRERLQLFVEVCKAVHHAHQKGVIHRDLKPGNVLVAESDGEFRAKVIDFGVAKATDDSLHDLTQLTGPRQFVGTLDYMAPEQFDGPAANLDTRVDVYALGVMMYQLLTGTLPFDVGELLEGGYDEVVRAIRSQDPVRPSTRLSNIGDRATEIAQRRRIDLSRLRTALRGELDWIVLRALDKERDRRYESAAALGDDVLRYLADEPVSARPPSRAYRLQKFARRYRALLALAALLFVTLVAGVVTAGLGWSAASAANADAQRQLVRATEVRDVLVEMLDGASPYAALGVDTTLMRNLLDRTSGRLFDGSIEDDAIRSDLHYVAAEAYRDIGEHEQAVRHLRELLQLLQPTDAIRLKAMISLGLVLAGQGELVEAGRLSESAQALLTRLPEREHPELQMVRFRAAQLQVDVVRPTDLKEAVRLQERIVADANLRFGAEADATLEASRMLGRLYRDSGQAQRATEVLEEQLAISTRLGSVDSLDALTVRQDLLFLRFNSGQPQQAEDDARFVHERLVDLFGETHPSTLVALSCLGVIYGITGRPEPAIEALEEVMAHPAASLGERSVGRLQVVNVLAACYGTRGDTDRAAAMMREALRMCEEQAGVGSVASFPIRNNLVSLLTHMGELDEAEKLVSESIALEQKALGADHEMALAAELFYGELLMARGDHEGAIRYFDELLPRMVASLGENNRFVRRARTMRDRLN